MGKAVAARVTRTLIVVALTGILAACATAIYRNHGYIPLEQDLQQITVGVDTRESVEGTVGSPGAAGITDQSGWYYVRYQTRTFAFYAPEEVDRQVLAISFDGDGVVSNIERFGLERGRVVRLSRRVTTSNTQGIGLLRQAFGNLGRFTAEDFFDDEG